MAKAKATGPRSWVPPRIGTPRNPGRETYGGQVAEVAQRLGKVPMPHQRHVWDVALEIDPATGGLAYDEIDWTIMRQCGKTFGVFSKQVWRCTVVPHRLGPQRATYTAQTRNDARKKLERDFAVDLRGAVDTGSFREITNPKARPGRSTREWKISLNNGSEHMLFGRGNYLQIDAPVKRAGHGDTLDDGTIDEARFQRDDMIEQAMRPSQATRTDAQLWVISTSGDEESVYLWRKVLAGRRSVELAERSRVAYFEWSLPPDADLDDEEAWWEFHPALGRTIPYEFIRAELERARRNPDEGAEDVFRQEYANQWVRVPVIGDGGRRSPIPIELWNAPPLFCEPHESEITGALVLGVDVSPDGGSASIVAVGRRDDGLAHVEALDLQAGTFWLEDRLAQLRADWEPVAIAYDGGGPAAALAPEIFRAAGQVKVEPITGRDYAAACEGFLVQVMEKRLRHLGGSWLEAAVDGAAKKHRGDGWLWDRQTALADITPLVAATTGLRVLEMLAPVDDKRPVFWA